MTTAETWRAIARGWRVFVPAILGYGVAQYALVLPDLTPSVTPLFLVLVVLAYLLDVLLVAVVSVGASAAARGLPLRAVPPPPHRVRRLERIVGWSGIWVAVASVVAVFHAVIAAIILLVGAAVMPAIVAGRGPRAWLRPLRWLPLQTFVWGVLSSVGVLAGAAADAELGFLVGGPVGAAGARVVSGVIGMVVLCASAVLTERAEARRNLAGRTSPTARALSSD